MSPVLFHGEEVPVIRGLPWEYDDGGRAAAGFSGQTGDCVIRAAAIVTGRPYREVYDLACEVIRDASPSRTLGRETPRNGMKKAMNHRLYRRLGLEWTPLMKIGTGCTVHLRPGELPPGRLIASVSKHLVAVVDGVARDLADPCRGGTRCVYGIWRPR